MKSLDIISFAFASVINVLLLKCIWRFRYWHKAPILCFLQFLEVLSGGIILIYPFPSIYRMIWDKQEPMDILVTILCACICFGKSSRFTVYSLISIFYIIFRLSSHAPFEVLAQFHPTIQYWISIVIAPFCSIFLISSIYDDCVPTSKLEHSHV